MKRYEVVYRVVFEAENENIAECFSVDLEGDIQDINKRIKFVNCDPYVEELK